MKKKLFYLNYLFILINNINNIDQLNYWFYVLSN